LKQRVLRKIFLVSDFPFLQGILRKTGGWMWCFDGEFVVEAW